MKYRDILIIKNNVRERDGNKCTSCSMTLLEHLEKYGRTLEVHRKVADSEYSENGCVTLCRLCHNRQPKNKRVKWKFKPTPLGTFLKRLRKERNLTIRELAGMAGINHSSIAFLESGARQRPSYDMAKNLAEALGIQMSDFPVNQGN